MIYIDVISARKVRLARANLLVPPSIRLLPRGVARAKQASCDHDNTMLARFILSEELKCEFDGRSSAAAHGGGCNGVTDVLFACFIDGAFTFQVCADDKSDARGDQWCADDGDGHGHGITEGSVVHAAAVFGGGEDGESPEFGERTHAKEGAAADA